MAAEWPQFRGPNRNGISPERGLTIPWAGKAPKTLWTARVGEGYSSIAVRDNRVYTVGNFNNNDNIVCIQANSGKILWQYKYPCGAGDYSGPRATPAVHDGNVYTFSREGLALCLNAATGKVVWRREVGKETGAEQPGWGFASSPLIMGNLVIYNAGRSGAALDKATGNVVWKSGGGPSGYASPVPFTIGSQSGVLIFAGKGLVAVAPQSGRTLWEYPWETSYDVNAADPVVVGDTIFISSNYGKGGALLRLVSGRINQVWQSREMKNHFNSCVYMNGGLFGNDENTLKCIDVQNGRERWRMRGLGKGGLIAVEEKLLVITEDGELVVVAATPTRYTELVRASVLDGECWTQPVLANGLFYARNHKGNMVCIDLRGKV